jgi:excisionase family DNA binding protein
VVRMSSPAPHSQPRFLNAAQVADLLDMSEDWVYERAKSGELPNYKLPGGRRRFPYDELLAELEKFRQARSSGR